MESIRLSEEAEQRFIELREIEVEAYIDHLKHKLADAREDTDRRRKESIDNLAAWHQHVSRTNRGNLIGVTVSIIMGICVVTLTFALLSKF